MEQDLFLNLPQEIVIEILSRLPIISIVKCESVCKWWLYLIKSDEFVKSHLSKSKSVPGLALSQSVTRYKPHQIIEFIDTQNSEAHILFSFGFSFRFPQEVEICGSANGLLLLVNFERIDDNVSVCNPFICNPITREYIRLPSPTTKMCGITFGFGVSKVSSEYKVIAAFRECHLDPLTGYPLWDLVEDKFKVYTLGTGSSWRSISASRPKWWNDCVFLNGKFHWLVYEEKSIKCFDIETECFSTFSTPEFVFYGCRRRILCELGDHGLCLYDDKYNGGGGDDDVIWMMKEYGDDKSWTKEFLIKRPLELWVFIKPIKILKDGDILFAMECSNRLYRYSIKTQTFREIYRRASSDYKPIYTPTFFSLKTFSKENVSLF